MKDRQAELKASSKKPSEPTENETSIITSDFSMQPDSIDHFTPYDEFQRLINRVEGLARTFESKSLNEMREKVGILEREKRKLSEENVSLKRELIKMQDLL